MTPSQDAALRSAVQGLKALGWSHANIRAAIYAILPSHNPPPITQADLNALFASEGV
jgi:hypothetical protein